MDHLCNNCTYKTEATSLKDFYDKTFKVASLKYWGIENFKHLYWLCRNPDVSNVIHTNGTVVHKVCVEYNKDGGCTFFRAPDAEDIIPSDVSIELKKIEETEEVDTESDDEEEVHYYVDDDLELEITVTPHITPAVTEEVQIEVQKKDIDGVPMVDDDGNPVMETTTDTVTIEPEIENDQDIHCSYQWYKNGRKLFQSKTATLKVDTTKEAVDEYYCVVTQAIAENGDGGIKVADVKSESVVVTIEKKPEDDTPEDNTDDTPTDNTDDEPTDDSEETNDEPTD